MVCGEKKKDVRTEGKWWNSSVVSVEKAERTLGLWKTSGTVYFTPGKPLPSFPKSSV